MNSEGSAPGTNEPPGEIRAAASEVCSDSAGAPSARRWQRHRSFQGELSDLDADWDRLEELPGAETYKSNPLRDVIALPATSEHPAIVIKRYRVRGRKEELKYLFLPSRAKREWRALLELESRDFPAPQPLAMFEERSGGRLRSAGLVMAKLENTAPLSELIFSDSTKAPVRDQLLRRAGALVAELHDGGIAHPDLHLGNFLGSLIDRGTVSLVDLHAVHHRRVVRGPRRRSDLAKLIHSLGTEADRHAVRSVLGAYLEAGGDRFLGELEEEIDRVQIEARQRERIRLASRDRRCWRTTSQFRRESRGNWRVYRRREFSADALAPFLEGSWKTTRDVPDRSVGKKERVELPTAASSRPLIVTIVDHTVIGGLWARLSRGALGRAWGAARRFEVRSFPHAIAYAYAFEIEWGVIRRSLLVTEAKEGLNLADAVIARSTDRKELDRFIRTATDTLAPLIGRLHRSGMIPGQSRPSDWLVLDREPAGSAIILNNLETIEISRIRLLERERSNLVSLALLPGGIGTQRQRLRFLKKYFGEKPIYPATLAALQEELVARQVQQIEELLVERRSDTIQSHGPTQTKAAQHLDLQ